MFRAVSIVNQTATSLCVPQTQMDNNDVNKRAAPWTHINKNC